MTETGADGSRHDSVAYRMVRAMFVVLFFWVFWKFGGYLITAAVMRRFGPGAESDAYFFATQTVLYLIAFSPALAILVPAFMPVLIDERARNGEAAARKFAATVLTVTLIAVVLMMAGLFIWKRPVTDTLVGGFSPEAREIGVGLLKWVIPGAGLMVVFLALRVMLNSYKVFSYPAAAEALQKLFWFGALILLVSRNGIEAPAQGLLVGSVTMVGIAAWGLRKRAEVLRPGFPAMDSRHVVREIAIGLAFVVLGVVVLRGLGRVIPKDAAARNIALMTGALLLALGYSGALWKRAAGRSGPMARMAVLAVPLAISAFFAAYREVVTRHFQSYTLEGVYSGIEGAKKIVNFPTELVALALSVAMLPYLCELAAKQNREALADIVTKSLRMLAVAFVPMTVMTLVLAYPLVRLAFDRGDWAPEQIRYAAIALRLTVAALAIYASERVVMQAFFSLQRMWAPALLGIATSILQVGVLMLLIRGFGMKAPEQIFYLVAAAFPISRTLKNVAMVIVLKRYVNVLPLRPTLVFAGKLAVMSVAVGAVGWVTLRWTEEQYPYEHYRLEKVVVDDFEDTGARWSSAMGPQVQQVEGMETSGTKRHALRIPPGCRSVAWINSFESGGTDRLRCRVLVESEQPVQIEFVLMATGPEEKEIEWARHSVDVAPGQWRQVVLTRDDFGLGIFKWGDVSGLEVRLAEGHQGVMLDDVTLRREPRRMYDVMKLVHCTLPSIAAGMVMILALLLLKFDETGFVIQWVKDRGWKRRGQARKAEETAGDE